MERTGILSLQQIRGLLHSSNLTFSDIAMKIVSVQTMMAYKLKAASRLMKWSLIKSP